LEIKVAWKIIFRFYIIQNLLLSLASHSKILL